MIGPPCLCCVTLRLSTKQKTCVMTDNNLLREPYRSMEMMRCRPNSGGAHSLGTNSDTTAAARTSGGKGDSCDDGHFCGVVSHVGSCYHNVDDISACVVIPLESRSARFCRVGQYCQVAVGSCDHISFMRSRTNTGSCFWVFNHLSTIWLSDQI